MAPITDFVDYYKTISDTELINILDNLAEYQPAAVQAAKQEFANRQLSVTQIEDARKPLVEKQAKLLERKEKIKAVESRIKTAGNSFVETINPIQSGTLTSDKIIRLIVIVFTGIFLYRLLKNYRDYGDLIEAFPGNPLLIGFYFLEQLILPVAVFAFWKRRTAGWILLTILLTYSAAAGLWMLYQAFAQGYSVNTAIFLATPSKTSYIVQLSFEVGIMYVLCKSDIKEVFTIDKSSMAMTIGLTAFLTLGLLSIVS